MMRPSVKSRIEDRNKIKSVHLAKDLSAQIEDLNHQRFQLEADRNFTRKREWSKSSEAAVVRRKLEALNLEIERKQVNELKQQHKLETDKLQEDFDRDLLQYKEFWAARIEKFESNCKQVKEELFARHDEEREEYEKNIKMNLFGHPRMTPEVLNTEYQISKLVKEQRYEEAERLQKKSKQMVGAPADPRKGKYCQTLSYLLSGRSTTLWIDSKRSSTSRRRLS